MNTVPTRPDKGRGKKSAGLVQPLAADDPRLPQVDQTPGGDLLGDRRRCTKSDTLTLDERIAKNRQEADAFLATAPPIPTVAEIAAPFLQGIYDLHDFVSQECSLDQLMSEDSPAMIERATEISVRIRRAIDIVSDFARSCTNVGDERTVAAMHSVLERIADVESMRWVDFEVAERIMAGADEVE